MKNCIVVNILSADISFSIVNNKKEYTLSVTYELTNGQTIDWILFMINLLMVY